MFESIEYVGSEVKEFGFKFQLYHLFFWANYLTFLSFLTYKNKDNNSTYLV